MMHLHLSFSFVLSSEEKKENTCLCVTAVLNKTSDVRDLLHWLWHPLTVRDPASITQVKERHVGRFNHPGDWWASILSCCKAESSNFLLPWGIDHTANCRDLCQTLLPMRCVLRAHLLQTLLVSIEPWQPIAFSWMVYWFYILQIKLHLFSNMHTFSLLDLFFRFILFLFQHMCHKLINAFNFWGQFKDIIF